MNNEIIPLQPSSNDSIQSFIYPIHNMNSIAFFLSPPLQILHQSQLNWYATKQQNEQPLWYTYHHLLQTAPTRDLGQKTSHLQQQQVVFGNSLKPKAWDTEGRAASRWHQPGQPQPCALCQASLGIWPRQLASSMVLCAFKKSLLFSADLWYFISRHILRRIFRKPNLQQALITSSSKGSHPNSFKTNQNQWV